MHVDDLPCLLNPVHAVDLRRILEVTPSTRRVAVALAFADLTIPAWALHAELNDATVWRWLKAERKVPFGGALRLAKVIGQPAELVFSAFTT